MPREPLTPEQQRRVEEAVSNVHPAYGPGANLARLCLILTHSIILNAIEFVSSDRRVKSYLGDVDTGAVFS